MNEMNEEDKAVLLDHDYDGIQELDHPLPRWWVMSFWGGIIFAIIYFSYYVVGSGPSLQYEYGLDLKHLKEVKKEYLKNLSQFNSDTYHSYSQSPEMLKVGESNFNKHCVACHRDKAAGDIGPNLTDEYWLYAEGTPETIFPFILTGNPSGGMPAWAEMLKEDELYAITAYLMSIQGIEQENPKAPQGERFERIK